MADKSIRYHNLWVDYQIKAGRARIDGKEEEAKELQNQAEKYKEKYEMSLRKASAAQNF